MSDRFERKCEICQRLVENNRFLGPLIDKQSILVHYNCVLFSPVQPSAEEIQEVDGVCGVTLRYIRTEGARAKKLVSVLIYLI